MERKLITLLKNTDFFGILEDNEIEKILKNYPYKILIYKKDEYIAFRGDEIDGLYINLKGNLIAEMLKENGNVKKIEELKNGKILAAAFIFGDINRFPVDIIAKSDIEIFYLEKRELINILNTNAKLLVKFINEISNKAQFLSRNLWDSLTGKTINQKLSEYILKNETEDMFKLEISIKELAEYFNISRPSLSRVIKNFIDNKIIEKIEKGKYRILSKEKLKEIQQN